MCYSLIKATSGRRLCYCAPSGHHSLCFLAALSLSLSCCLSCFLPPLRTESFLPSSFSFLIYSILLVSFSWLFLLTSRIFVFSSKLKPLYLCLSGPPHPSTVVLLTPLAHTSYLYSPGSFSYSLPNVPKSLLLTFTLIFSVLSHIQIAHHHHSHPFLSLFHVCFVFFPPSVFSLIVLSRADRHSLWDVYRQNA